MLMQALFMGGVFGLVMTVFWKQDPIVVAAFLPPFIAMMYASYWMTNRIAMRFRPRRPVEEYEPVEPTTTRPEHAQRRRSRRRARGRRDQTR